MLFYDPRFLEHVGQPYHVERPDRLRAIMTRLGAEGFLTDVRSPRPASYAEVRRVHR